MKYLTTTFSPAMLSDNHVVATVVEVSESQFQDDVHKALSEGELTPAVGHENTAALLQARLGLEKTLWARVNLTLNDGDVVLAAIPFFRAPESREFTDEEVRSAKFRFFKVYITDVADWIAR